MQLTEVVFGKGVAREDAANTRDSHGLLLGVMLALRVEHVVEFALGHAFSHVDAANGFDGVGVMRELEGKRGRMGVGGIREGLGAGLVGSHAAAGEATDEAFLIAGTDLTRHWMPFDEAGWGFNFF